MKNIVVKLNQARSWYLANKRSLHDLSQGLEITMLIIEIRKNNNHWFFMGMIEIDL